MPTVPDESAGADGPSNHAVKAIWDTNAAFWDEHMGDGNAFQRLLVGPATERLLAVQPGARVLEIACGNGVMARRLAHMGARVLATDFSAAMVARARARGDAGIEYRVVDATDVRQLLALGAGQFDAAVCNMAIMDMAAIQPLMSAVKQLLVPGGCFVFSTVHPCFNSGLMRRVIREEDIEGELRTTYAIEVRDYTHAAASRGLGMIGQPVPQYYFHRTLSEIFGCAFQAGLMLDGLEEPAFDATADAQRPFDWTNFHGIPPVLVARLRAGSSR